MLFLAISMIAQDNTLWKINFAQEPLESWKFNNLTGEITGDMLRLRETGPRNYGSINRIVNRAPGYRYLQIKSGRSESGNYLLRISNTSKGGSSIGSLVTGLNTFDLSNQPDSARFMLTILQLGISGSEPGPWADLEYAALVKVPSGGLTVDLLSTDNSNIAKVGDKIRFRYFALEKPNQKLKLNCYLVPDFVEIATGKEIILKPEPENPLIFSTEITITNKFTGCNSTKNERLMAALQTTDGTVTGTGNFDLAIATAIPPSRQAVSPEATPWRKLWQEKTTGVNLAAGKEVIFSLPPSYAPLKTDKDNFKLTNGKLSNNTRDRIWFDKEAAGWARTGAEFGINMLIDLGESRPVDKAVIRCLGGRETINMIFPKRFDAFVSRDGKNFYRTASMQKLMPGEKDQSDFKHYFYLDENGQSYVYPFELPINADTRYIGLTVYGATGNVFCDQLAVIKSEKPKPNFNTVYQAKSEPFHTRGFLIRSLADQLAITDNAFTPNYFFFQDMRTTENIKKPVKLVMELPTEIKLVYPENAIIETLGTKQRLKIALTRIPPRSYLENYPLYFKINGKLLPNAEARVYAECEGETPIKVTMPITALTLPEFKPFSKLYIGPGWMREGVAMEWPDFFNSWRKLGFNQVSVFPYYWNNQENIDKHQKFANEARKHGFGITMVECPFHIMMKGIKPGHEMFSQLDGKPSGALCPSYRGESYYQELERISRDVKISSPDYIFWDIECWYRGATEAKACSRCRQGQADSGKNMEEYLKDMGTASMADLKNAVKKAGINPMPVIGSYNHHAASPVHHIILDFNRYYPASVDLASPSLYVSGRAADIHRNIRLNYELLKTNRIIPWLTAGTYGEFESYKMEQMVLEALLNGSMGITYYYSVNFDTPLDYYYHAKALSLLAPYEELLFSGKPTKLTADRNDIYLSAMRHNNEMLILCGNYDRMPESITVSLPDSAVITDIRNGEKFPPASQIKLNIPKSDIRLLHVKFQ